MTNHCEECRGRGWIVVPDGGAGAARPCVCRSSANGLEISLRTSGLKDMEIRMVQRPWDPSKPAPAWLEDWATAAARGDLEEGNPERTPCRVIVGQTGAGKTMSAAKIAAAYVRAGGLHLLWCAVRAAEARIMESRLVGERSTLEGDLTRAGLLVIDDLAWQLFGMPAEARGRESINETYRRRLAIWTLVIDERLRAGKPTLITSNLHPSDWGDIALATRLSTPGTIKGRQQEDYRPELQPLQETT